MVQAVGILSESEKDGVRSHRPFWAEDFAAAYHVKNQVALYDSCCNEGRIISGNFYLASFHCRSSPRLFTIENEIRCGRRGR